MSEEQPRPWPVTGVILAGGLSRRMGGDKPMKEIGGRPMMAYVVEKMLPQVDRLIINANGDPHRFDSFGLPVVPDGIDGNPGPLAGILAGMRWSQVFCPQAHFMASAAVDTPFFPTDLVERLAEGCGRDEGTIAVAASFNGVHPVFGLWPIALADDLEEWLKKGKSNKILDFADRHLRLNVPFDHLEADGEQIDPFFNVNTPDDAEQAETMMAALTRMRAAG
ncbi:molybdenum cofactor guanylyltransferase MobA [Afifella sp. IM 167]|uniref:molybdenum cofactor guanylyltransferase MobA n=1 Tax=Afifella sp. IM 167 TaxID=2033586 RepID=UPI001CCA1AE8